MGEDLSELPGVSCLPFEDGTELVVEGGSF
jgi:hypothetical protein